jgi:ketosteroid isomerase-like protein
MLDADLTSLIEQTHTALDAFMRGDPEPFKSLYSQKDDIVIANPFGPPAKGWAMAAAAMDRAAANYRDGEAVGFDRVSEYGTETLAYIIEIERYRAKVGGAEALNSFAARVTTIFRREDGTWRVVLRHADPTTSARPPASVFSN